MYWLLGALIGLGVGYLLRPTVPLFGIPIPLEIFLSPAPADLPFKKQLAIHLAVAICVGALVFGLLGHLLTRRPSDKQGES